MTPRPSVPDLLAFATAPHRRPSPPQLHEQPRLSLEARRAHRGFLEFPIARQALLVVVPEYDRIAPPLVEARAGRLQGLANGSLLQNFALAAALARLTLAPADYAAAALAAGDEEGRERLHAALEAWPAGLRRRVHARFRALAAERASARAARGGARAIRAPDQSQNSGASLINSAPTCLRNSDSESHEPRSKAGGQGAESQQFRPSDNPRGRGNLATGGMGQGPGSPFSARRGRFPALLSI